MKYRIEERVGGRAVVDPDGVTVALACEVNSHKGEALAPGDPRRRSSARAQRTANVILLALERARC